MIRSLRICLLLSRRLFLKSVDGMRLKKDSRKILKYTRNIYSNLLTSCTCIYPCLYVYMCMRVFRCVCLSVIAIDCNRVRGCVRHRFHRLLLFFSPFNASPFNG